MSRKIIAYKLKYPGYEKAASVIAGYTNGKLDSLYDIEGDFTADSTDAQKFRDCGLLNIWFEPVYEEYKVGDWLYCMKTPFYGASIEAGDVRQVLNTSNLRVKNFDIKGAEDFTHLFRKATPEEIRKATQLNFKKGDYLYCHTDLVMDSDYRKEALAGKLYKCISNSSIIDESGDTHSFDSSGDANASRWFRLATKQEVEQHTAISIGGVDVKFLKDGIEISGQPYNLGELRTLQIFLTNHATQVKSLNVGCSGQFKVTLEDITKILEKLK